MTYTPGSFKEGADLTNAALNAAVGGLADADAVAVGGAGIIGGQGGAAVAVGGNADADAANVNVQGGFAGGTEDNVINSGNVGPITT